MQNNKFKSTVNLQWHGNESISNGSRRSKQILNLSLQAKIKSQSINKDLEQLPSNLQFMNSKITTNLKKLSAVKLGQGNEVKYNSSSSGHTNIQCAICMESCTGVKEPYRAPCGHICCKQCWINCLEKNKSACPVCRKVLKSDQLKEIVVNK